MSLTAIQQEMEESLRQYNEHTVALASLLDEARQPDAFKPDLMKKISDMNTCCNELHERYLNAFKIVYGQ